MNTVEEECTNTQAFKLTTEEEIELSIETDVSLALVEHTTTHALSVLTRFDINFLGNT